MQGFLTKSPQNLVNCGPQTTKTTTISLNFSHFLHCQRVHTEVDKRESTKRYRMFRNEPDLKIHVKNLGFPLSFPKNVGLKNCYFRAILPAPAPEINNWGG